MPIRIPYWADVCAAEAVRAITVQEVRSLFFIALQRPTATDEGQFKKGQK
jgi:hypothetical protein